MNGNPGIGLLLAAVIGCGVIGGVFFAFSAFVMRALARLPEAEGIAAMQAINSAVIRPLFLVPFLGTGVLCAVLVIDGVRRWGDADAFGLVAGGVLYIVATLLVTIAGNVPLNDALAKVRPGDADAAAHWQAYVRRWTTWNHVRTVAAIVAAAVFTVAFRAGG